MLRPRLLFAAFLALTVSATAEITPGEILAAEMNCTACHSASPDVVSRLAPRTAPKLGQLRLSPHWLRDFLMDPQKTKPDTLMPDMLHKVPAEEKPGVVEALVHFLVGNQGLGAGPEVGASPAKIEAGKALY